MLRRSIIVVAALSLVALFTCGNALAAKRITVKPGVYKLAIPAPGHVTVAAVEVTVKKHGRGRPASRVLLDLPNRFGLPDSVRFFYARHRISTAPLRYELLLLAVNRATGRSATATKAVHRRVRHRRVRHRRAHTARTQFNNGSIVLQFPSRPAFGHTCGSCGQKLPKTTNCTHCWFKKTTTSSVQVPNADTAGASDLAGLVTLLRNGWTTGGDSNAVFGNPATGAPRDPTLDSGYFDDHRAFGWAPASLQDPAPALHGVVDDLLTGQTQQIIPGLELIGQADLNNNGQLDSAASPGGGTPS
ncbi:MAG TPA: hypothetical protein VF032_20685 [Thermoleophilaceae bacterium]